MEKNPSQGQKMIFIKFEQWGMGLGMFWWSNRPRLGNLSLICKIMKICEKQAYKAYSRDKTLLPNLID